MNTHSFWHFVVFYQKLFLGGGGKLDGCWNIGASFPVLLLLIILIDMWHCSQCLMASCVFEPQKNQSLGICHSTCLQGPGALWLTLIPPPRPPASFPPATLDSGQHFVSRPCDSVHSVLPWNPPWPSAPCLTLRLLSRPSSHGTTFGLCGGPHHPAPFPGRPPVPFLGFPGHAGHTST